jgi:hypothetical protein
MSTITTYAVQMGDPSGDGHCQTDTRHLRTNLTFDQIKAALKKGLKAAGWSTSSNRLDLPICEDYAEHEIEYGELRRLAALGAIPDWVLNDDDDSTHWVTSDDFFNLWIAIVRLGARELGDGVILEEISGLEMPVIEIGGYGLFE